MLLIGASALLAVALSFPVAAASPPPAAAAEESVFPDPDRWLHMGPVRVRDLTPFGILRLDFLPAHAVPATPGTWAFEVNLSYQNTYVASDNVARYLFERNGGRRAPLTADDVEAIRALDGDAYLVDLELGLYDLTAHYRFDEHWGGYLTIPVLSYQDGAWDGLIEDFHDELGFSTANRGLLPRNDFGVVVSTSNGELIALEPPTDGLGDPVVGARYSLVARPERWNVILEAAAKLPWRSDDPFLSSGRADGGVQVSLQRFFGRNALYLSLSGVYMGGSDSPASPDLETWIPTAVAAWELRLTRQTNAILQLYASPSVIQESTVEELTEEKYLLTAGLQSERGGWFYRLAITENLANFENTPDVGVTLSAAKVVLGD